MSGQPAQGDNPLIFGKYKDMDAAEEGFGHTVDELVRTREQTRQLQAELEASRRQNQELAEIARSMASVQPQSPAPRPLVDDEGNLDVDNLLRTVDDQLNNVREALPSEIQKAVSEALGPVVRTVAAKNAWMQDNPEAAEFTDAEFQRTLARNPTYARVFNTLVTNEETAKDAYQTVYDLWKANRSSVTPSPTPKDRESRKAAAADPAPMGGVPLAPPGEGQQKLEELRAKAAQAQDLLNPDMQVAFAKEFIKGGKLDKMIGDLPDWADDFDQVT